MTTRAEAALRAILADPYGCGFCDSGKLRNPKKDHEPTCGFAMATAALTAAAGVPDQEHILQKPGQNPDLLPSGNTAAEVGGYEPTIQITVRRYRFLERLSGAWCLLFCDWSKP